MTVRDDGESEVLIRFGRKVRDVRQSKSLSQEELADKAKVHRTYIGMIERGEKNATLITIIRISDALGVSAQNLISDL